MNLYFNGIQSIFRLDPTLADQVARNPLDPIPITYGTTSQSELLLDTVSFGDGYEQVAESGTRPIRRQFKLTFAKKRRIEILALRRFFEGTDVYAQTGSDSGTIYNRRPSEFFYMKLPFPFQEDNEPPLRLLMTSAPSIRPEQYDSWTLDVDVKEWFGL